MPVTHAKTNDIADWTQAELDAQIALGNFPPGTVLADITLPSDWNAGHTVSISVSEINATGTPDATTFLRGDGSWQVNAGGTVTTASVVSANGFAGSVANATTTPAITLTTTITGILSGNGTAISAASTTGSGDIVLATSPVLTTPNIGSATGSISGNAGTATSLATARAIGGVNFDGTAAITPTQIQPAAENSDTTCFPLVVNAASGTAQQPKYNSSFGYNASTNALTATTFIGALTGNASTVTTNANLTGDVTSVGNATTIGAGKVTEAMQVIADNTTNDVSTSKHGYAPKAPNDATKYLDGTGAYTVPAGGGGSGISIGQALALPYTFP